MATAARWHAPPPQCPCRLAASPRCAALCLDKARAALRALDEAVADVSQSASAPAGRVRISVGIGFGHRFVWPVLPALAERHPALRIEVDLDNRPVDLVGTGFDIGIRGGFIEDSSSVARRVAPLPVALPASPGYLRRAGVPCSDDDLATHRCAEVRFGSGTLSIWRFGKGKRAFEMTPLAQVLSSDPESLPNLALADAGIVQAGLHHALPYLRSGRLKLMLTGLHHPGTREVVLHYPHRLYLAPQVRVVVDGLLAHFAATPDLHATVEQLTAEFPHYLATVHQPAGAERPAGRAPAKPKPKRTQTTTTTTTTTKPRGPARNPRR